jgi:hypothetical protein
MPYKPTGKPPGRPRKLRRPRGRPQLTVEQIQSREGNKWRLTEEERYQIEEQLDTEWQEKEPQPQPEALRQYWAKRNGETPHPLD